MLVVFFDEPICLATGDTRSSVHVFGAGVAAGSSRLCSFAPHDSAHWTTLCTGMAMEYGVHPVNMYKTGRHSGYSDAFVPNAQAVHHPQGGWMATPCSLRDQRGYLESLLCKTVTTLNVLRNRQNKNERALNANPKPRTKRKKIEQNRWRTNKTIKTCENEEKVILDCLQVCNRNICTLELLFGQANSNSSPTVGEHNYQSSYLETDSTVVGTEFDWNGWAEVGDTCPFQRQCLQPSTMDEIPPEEALAAYIKLSRSHTTNQGDNYDCKPPPLPAYVSPGPQSPSTAMAPARPNTANTEFNHSLLSPEAVCFEPKVTHNVMVEEARASSEDKKTEQDKEERHVCRTESVDTLSVSGLMNSERVQVMLAHKRRFSDAAIGYMFRKLSSMARPGVVTRQSSCPPLGRREMDDGDVGPRRPGGLKRRTTW